ncbi:MAG: glycosyltransferase [Sulfolobales archaeon]
MFSVILEEVCRTGGLINVLRELERFNVIVPGELYESLENISFNMQHYLDKFRYKRLHDILLRVERSILEVKNNILFAKKFLEKFIQNSETNSIINRLQFAYSMIELPLFVVVGAFLAKSLRKKLYIQLQGEPFKPLRELVICDWISRVTFSEQQIFREIIRLILLTSQSAFPVSRYSFSYALSNNLDGLLAVSEAPLMISGLASWANKKGIKMKVVRPGNAIEEDVSRKYIDEDERHRLLRRKEDVAIYYTRLHSPKGLFDILPIARKLAIEGYRLMVAGRFESIVEKKRFFKICEQKEIKNIEYLGWLPHKDLFDVVSRSKVLIYPSHSDAFSLVVLEALFLGCSVVAYDIPAIRSVYKGLKPVKIVKEYDYKAMAEEAIKILKRDVSKHEEEHLDDNFMNFLKMHSSWRNVAKADIEAIREMMNYPSRTC